MQKNQSAEFSNVTVVEIAAFMIASLIMGACRRVVDFSRSRRRVTRPPFSVGKRWL